MARRGRIRAGTALAAAGLGLVGREVYRRRNLDDLTGQVALVTGGSRGLGFLLAREFARSGCHIVICARDAQELEQAQRDLEREGTEVMAVTCDISDRADVERMVAEATQRFGRIDILVNNAGIIQVGPVHNMTLEDFERSMNIMYWGVVYPTLAVLPQMRERQSGRIVNITSIGGKVSVPHLLPYTCAKFAAVGFSEGLGAELAKEGIAVTTIAPGLMRTGSYLNVEIKGHKNLEYGMFALASSLPIITIDAERAARQIVRAARRGDTERILTTPANIGARFHGLFPGTTVELFGLVNRFLPSGKDVGTDMELSRDVQKRMSSPVLNAITYLGRKSAERFHERPPD